jgi:hypothetical protein
MFFEGRGATEITIISPYLDNESQLSNIFANFETLRALPSTVIISCTDQLSEGTTIRYKELLEGTIKACSNTPALKTKVGIECSASVRISSRKRNIFTLATNAKEYTSLSGQNKAFSLGDDVGLRTGSSARPYKTLVFRSYYNGSPDNNPDNWIIFPAADVEGDIEQLFNNKSDRGYLITFTAYDPTELNIKIILGNPDKLFNIQIQLYFRDTIDGYSFNIQELANTTNPIDGYTLDIANIPKQEDSIDGYTLTVS